MSDLTFLEKRKIEKLLEMGSGYVFDFSNRTFAEFFLDNVGIDIYDDKYDYGSGSKANRLRGFWQKESNYIVGKLLSALLDYWRVTKQVTNAEITPVEQSLFDDCTKIAMRLKQDSPTEHIDLIRPVTDDKNFVLLKAAIRDSIQNNEPEVALDRLHTFFVMYVRQLCSKHDIHYDKNRPLHSLLGQYVNYLRQAGLIETQMTEKILKAANSILEDFNYVRNNQSLAHDNRILNYGEAMLIYKYVTSAIEFLQLVEERTRQAGESKKPTGFDEADLPF